MQQYHEAIIFYTQAIELSPEEAAYWGNRCYSYNWIAEFENAVNDCMKAIELDENNAYAYQQRQYAYEQLGKAQEAETDQKMYEKLIQD